MVGRNEGRQGYAAPPLVSSKKRRRADPAPSEISRVRAVDNPAPIGIDSPSFRVDNMPYGGVKDSGNTREGPAYAAREFTDDRLDVIDI